MRRRVSTFGAVVGVDVRVEAADEASKKGSVEKGKARQAECKSKWKVRKVRLCSNSSSRSQVGRGGNCRPKGRKEQEQERKREWKPRGRYFLVYLPAVPKANRGPGLARGTTSASTTSTKTKQGLEAAVGSLQRRTSQWPAGFCSVRGGFSWVQVVRALGAVLLLREPWHGNWGVGAVSGGGPVCPS